MTSRGMKAGAGACESVVERGGNVEGCFSFFQHIRPVARARPPTRTNRKMDEIENVGIDG